MNVADSTKLSAKRGTSRKAADARRTPTASASTRRTHTQRTRTNIADALAQLIREGNESPTAAEVARRARVALRTVYHHYGAMEAVYEEVIRRNEPQVARLITTLEPRLPLHSRVRQLVEQRCAVYQYLAPLRRAVCASHGARTSPAIRAAARRLEYVLARHASDTFGPELHGAPDRYGTLERIAALTSYDMWNRLSQVQRLLSARVQRHMTVTVLREFD
ncbi:MAG: TetR/AcrR family transcriptional regulator [Actinomycetota bacterium]